MLTQYDFDTWNDLETHVRQLTEISNAESRWPTGHFSHLLFRGQESHDWLLETTLERSSPAITDLAEYYKAIGIAKAQVETFTAQRWPDFDSWQIHQSLSDYETLQSGKVPGYDYLVYLRHHGFPSPLLDWTRSLYVAAFFAFRKPISDRVSIFVYQEHAGAGKIRSSRSPQVIALGPNIRSHPRHFLQQGEYTLCCEFCDESWHIRSHSSVFNKSKELSQDKLWKLTLPNREASRVLKKLDEYNINPFSLFQSEESLMETLARRLLLDTAGDL